ncbi:hypothetical protein [Parafrankia elaeagni]|uniref:hypothetical protein n=1 Tax=Parafrankia elaeagni TaxID=222534 RepID=UPI00037B6FE3|nr:hypothetical protein [Parafrankia elaeagni]
MSTDEWITERLRDRAATVVFQPSDDLWAGVRARVPGERRRRYTRRAVPALALALAAAGAATGVALGGGAENTVITPAEAPASPAGARLYPLTFTPAEEAQLARECQPPSSGPAELARFQPLDSRVWAAAGDEFGATVILTNGAARIYCDLPVGSAGRPDIASAQISGVASSSIDRTTVFGDAPRSDLDLFHRGSSWNGGGRTFHTAAGLVSSRVARVTVTTSTGDVREVPIQDGRIVVRSVQSDPQPGDDDYIQSRQQNYEAIPTLRQSTRPLIRAYDISGRLVGED